MTASTLRVHRRHRGAAVRSAVTRRVAVLALLAIVATTLALPTYRLISGSWEHAPITHTARASVNSWEAQADGHDTDVSADGRYVAFVSRSSGLGYSGNADQLWLRDTTNGVTMLVSRSTSGGFANGASARPAVSGDGRYVAFQSVATNLSAIDTTGNWDIYLWDRMSDTVTLISTTGIAPGNNDSVGPDVSGDGSRVIFSSRASNLDGDLSSGTAVFAWDRATGHLQHENPWGQFEPGGTHFAGTNLVSAVTGNHSLSTDGTHVAFTGGWGASGGLGADQPCFNGTWWQGWAPFTWDISAGQVQRLVNQWGVGCHHRQDGTVYFESATISSDGTHVGFYSIWGGFDLVIFGTGGGSTSHVAVSAAAQGNDLSNPALDNDAITLAFTTYINLSGDGNNRDDVYRILSSGSGLELISTTAAGGASNSFGGTGGSYGPSITADGGRVAFSSIATDLLKSGERTGPDTNNSWDVFVRDSYNEYLTAGQVLALLGRITDLINSVIGGDPVRVASGNLTDHWTDLDSSAWGLDWTRDYNSRNTSYGPWGQRWTGGFDTHATIQPDNSVELVFGDGHTVVFQPDGSGGYITPEETHGTLTNSSGTLHYTDFDGATRNFDPNGWLATAQSWDGQTITISRAADGRVLTAASTTGASLTFTWNPTTLRLTQVASNDGRTVAYGYDTTNGTLNNVTAPDGAVTHYTLTADGLMTETRDANNRILVANTFDDLGRVTDQTTPDGNVHFNYNNATRTVQLTDSVSGDTTTYVHDSAGRTTQIVDTTGHNIVRGFDAGGNGHLTSLTDRAGAQLQQEFTPDHLVAARTQVAANTDNTDRRVETTYDAQHRVTAITQHVAGGTDIITTYTYISTNRIPNTITGPAPYGAPNPPVTTTQTTNGLPTQATDPDGVVTSYQWDTTTRRLTSSTIAPNTTDASTTTYSYTPEGWIETVTTQLGHTTAYQYDAAGRVTLKHGPDDSETHYQYNASGQLTVETDPNGNTTTNIYDPTTGGLTSTQDRRGKTTVYQYNGTGDLTVVIEPDDDTNANNNPTTTYTYGPLGRLTSETTPTGVTTAYSYDNNGRVTAVRDANNNATTTTYWPDGDIHTRADALNHATTYTYDNLGRLADVADPDNNHTTYHYDAAGRTTQVDGPRAGQTETTTYTPGGRILDHTDAHGTTTHITYDDAGRTSQTTVGYGTPLAATTTVTYDDDGLAQQQISPEARITTFSYDDNGRLVDTTAPNGGITHRTYTALGQVATITDPTGGQVAYTYDSNGNIATVTDANNHTTMYTYDARNNRTSRTNALGKTETWTYNRANQTLSHTDPLGHTTTSTYDNLGRLATLTDPTGRLETRTYNAVDQLARTDWSDSNANTTYRATTYTASGRVATVTSPAGTTSYTYDAGGGVTYVDAPGTDHDLTYTYDPAGLRSSLTYPDDKTVAYTYDTRGRLATVAEATFGTTTYTYNRDDQTILEDLPGANDRTRTYNATTGENTRYVQHLDGTTSDTTLAHDLADRLTSAATVGGDAHTYSYDPAGQLTVATTNGTATNTYTYDALGRRTHSLDQTGTYDYTYDDANRLLTRYTPDPNYAPTTKAQINGQTIGTLVGHQPADTTYAYDDAGRRVQAATPVGSTSYTYAPDGRLFNTNITGTASRVQDRDYDPTGQLSAVVTNTNNTTTTADLTWDLQRSVPQLIATSDGANTIDLINGTGALGLDAPTGPAAVSRDHEGSTLATGPAAIILAAPGYDPYGQLVPPATPNAALAYRGSLQTGDLLHLNARDYDPVSGQFTSPDPLDGVDGTAAVANGYAYANNDPADQVDPLGLRATTDDQLGGVTSRQRTFSVPRVPGVGRVRIGQFIKENVVKQFGIELGRGDNRTFDPHMVDRNNRVYVEADFETGRGRLFYNYSCEADGVTCYSALSPEKTSSITERPNGVSVEYTIGNSVAQAQLDRCNENGLNCLALELATKFKISAHFDILTNGWGVCVAGSHSRFPSTEIYLDNSNGSIETIRQYDQVSGAVLGLAVPDVDFGCQIADLPGLGTSPPSSGTPI
ncbi:MAG: hypothetical protein QOI95_3108 [Acidimicrobiaceae bacterium]|jgi:RHS repeat-associated protein